MADAVTRMADAQAVAYARKIEKVYTQAAKEVKKKMDDFWKAHKEKAERLRKQVQAGTISERDYQAWLRGQVFQGKQWEQKLKDVTEVYVNADAKAREILGGTTKNVFMEAANHTAYDIEKQLGGAVAFNVYDKKTVERLTKDNPKMLPEWKIDEPKDYVWNEKRVQNAVAQGIIQGESVYDIGKRLTTELAASNANKMDMFARTAVTGAQNAGRIERMHETEEMGIKVKKRWLSAKDNRVRDAHGELDGVEVGVDEDFHNSIGAIRFPGDPLADPANTYNCRCTLIYVYPEYKDKQHFEEHKTYAEWMEKQENSYKAQHNNIKQINIYEQIGTLPERPRLKDFNGDYDALEKAREEYKLKIEEAHKKLDSWFNETYGEEKISEQEFNKWAEKKQCKIGPNMERVDKTALSVYTKRYEQLIKDFPIVQEMHDYWGVPFEIDFDPNALFDAEASHGITFGPLAFGDGNYKEHMFGHLKGTFTVHGENPAVATFDHEFGHQVYNAMKGITENVLPNEREKRREMQKDLFDMLLGKNGISEYATTNDDELFAEGFCAWYGGEKTEFAKSFGDFMKKWGGGIVDYKILRR